MANPERSFGEKNGARIRNAGIAFSIIGLFAPAILIPSLALAASGEVLRRVSNKK